MGGIEWLIEAHGCNAAALADLRKLQALFTRLIAELNLHPIDEAAWHEFPGAGGITGMFMLAESHLTCHTFPEYGSLCLNVFCCRPRPDWDFAGYMKGAFAATTVTVWRVDRPYQNFEGQVK